MGDCFYIRLSSSGDFFVFCQECRGDFFLHLALLIDIRQMQLQKWRAWGISDLHYRVVDVLVS